MCYFYTFNERELQQSRFLALVSDYDRLKELTEQAANSEDAALVQTLKTMDSLETKIQNVKNAFQGFYGNLGLESLFKGALDIVTNILNRLNQLPKLGKKIPVLAVAIGAQIMNVIKLLLNSAVSLFAKEWTTIGDIIRNNIVRGHKEGTEEGKKQLEKEKDDIEGEQLPTGKSKKGGGLRIARQVIGVIGTAITAASLVGKPQNEGDFQTRGLTQIAGGALSGVGQGLVTGASIAGHWGAVAGGVAGLAAALPGVISGFADLANAEKLAIEVAKEKATQTKQEAVLARAEARDLETTITKLKTLEDARYNSNEAYQEWLDYKNQIVDTYPELLAGYDAEGNAVINTATSYELLAAAREKAAKASEEERKAQLESTIAQNEEIDKILNGNNQRFNNKDINGYGLKNYNLRTLDGILSIQEQNFNFNNDLFSKMFAKVNENEDYFLKSAMGYDGTYTYLPNFKSNRESANFVNNLSNLNYKELAQYGFNTENTEELADQIRSVQEVYWGDIWNSILKPLLETEKGRELLGYNSVQDVENKIKSFKGSPEDQEAQTIALYQQMLNLVNGNFEAALEAQQEIDQINETQAKRENSFTTIAGELYRNNTAALYNTQNNQLLLGMDNALLENKKVDLDTQKGQEKQKEYVEQLIEWYNKLPTDITDKLKSIMSHTDQYTSQEAIIAEIEKLLGDLDPVIREGLEGYIEDTWENTNQGIQKSFRKNIRGSKQGKNTTIKKSATQMIALGNDQNDEISAQYLNAINSQWSDLVTNETNEVTATKNAKFLVDTYTKIAQLPPEANNALAGIMSGAELDTVEGIQAAIDAMKAYEAENKDKLEQSDLDLIDNSINALIEHKNNLFINTSLAVQRYISGLDKTIEDANKIYKVQTGGTDDFAEMQATLDKINSTKTDKMGFDEVYKFDETLGKFVFTVEGLREAQKANLEAINGEWERTSGKIDDSREKLDELSKNTSVTDSDNIIDTLVTMSQDESLDKLTREYYSELAKNYDGRVKTWNELYKLESENLVQAQENGEQANEAAQKLLAQSSKIAAFKAIDFTKIADGTISFAEAENNLITLLGEIYPNEKPEKLENFAKIEYGSISKGGQKAVNRYIALAKKAGQEIQSSIVEALLEQPLNAVKNAVSNLKGASIGEAVDLTSLQNVLGEANLKELFGDNYANGVLTINEEVASTMLNSLQSLRGMLNDQSQQLEIDKIISEYYSSSISELNKFTAGMVASSNLATVLANNSEVFKCELESSGQIVLDYAFDFIYANKIIYESASKAYEDGIVSLSNLNTSFLNSINANLLQNTSSMSILSSASSFDLNALNEFLTVYGERLDAFVNSFGEVTDDSAGIQAFGNGKYRIVDWDKFRAKFAASLSDTSEEYIDAYINFLTNSQDSKVNSKEALMTTLLPKLDSLTYAEIGQIAKRFGLTVDTVISYLEQNADGTFNGNALVNELDFNKYDEAFVKALNERESNIATDMISAIVAFSESSKGLYDNKVLGEAIDKYNKALQSLGETTNLTLFDAERILLNGGEQAVALAEQIAREGGQELSAQDIETIYRGAISRLTNAIDTIAAQEGAIVDRTTADIIAEAGGRVNELSETGQFVVEKAANLYEAYKNLLDRMAATGEATLADLNKVAALALENKDSEQQVIDALGDAAGMTYTRFGEILAQQGKALSEDLVNALEQSGIIKSLGGSRMMITDFSRFAEIMNWSAGSEQYISAFKSYNDSLIQMNRQAENNILEEVKKVGNAKGGDWVNLTQLMSKMDDVTAVKLEATLQQFGGFLEDGILKLESNANIPAIMQEIAQKAAESGGLLSDELAELADAVADTIKGYADLIKGAIKGSLTNVQAEQLQDWATQVGIGQLDFTPTQEGLKVATDQAMQLYQELSKIDSIQGQLVFDDLVSALSSDKSGRFENASATAAEIARVEESLASNERELQELRLQGVDSSSETYQNLINQKSELKEQLSLYREIQQAQSLDSSRYNFMDQDLPEMMQGPINYWNSWGQAFTAMNEAGQTGKMEIQDFYNIVGEMNNLMAASGETLQLGAYKLDGSAESAAALIEAGMGALTNIDGKGVKINLKEIGVDFASGAEGMDTNLQDGIRTLAQSQIDMLDAAIKMLEVVVAMEDLGNIDVDNNGVFSIGDIFKLDENGNATDEYTKDYQDFAEKLIEQSKTNEDLKEALETIKVDGITLKEMFDDASNGVKKLNISRDTYFSIMEAFVKAFQSGDYDLDTIQDSVWDVLNELMPDGTTIDVGERTVVVSGGTKIQLDWESENVKEALERVAGKDEEEKKQRLKELTAQYLNNEPISVEDTITVLIATNKITIEDNGTYTTEDGSTFTSPTEAVRYQQMKDIKADNLTDLHDNMGNFIGYKGELKVGDKVINVSNVGGRMLYHSDELNQDFESLDELIHQEFLGAQHNGFSGDEEDYAELVYGIKIKTRVKIESQEAWDNRTKGQNDELVNAILSGDMSKIKDAASEVGLTIKAESVSDMSQEEYNQLLELAGIENKTTIMNLQITSSESSDPRLVELVTSEGTITKEMELDLTTTGDLSENFINAINNLNPANLMVVAFNLAAMSSSLKTISGVTFQNVDDMKTRWDEILVVVKEVAEAIASIGDIKLPTPSGNSGGNGGNDNPATPSDNHTVTTTTVSQTVTDDGSGIAGLVTQLGTLNQNASDAETPVSNIAGSLSSIAPENATIAQNFTSAINDIKADGVNNAGNYKDAVNDTGSTGADNASAFKRAVNDIPDKSGAINRLKNALDGISGVLNLTLKVSLDVSGLGPAKGTVSGVSSPATWRSNHIGGNAYYHYNRAYAKGTLMGELGPELVVSHGRYFVVGQNGPEMVDLADDAIVFNHLQTRKLLANGKISSHGSPVTNERNATSFATGNMEGDALASASSALAALKQLRAMWQSMLEASLSDLGRTAGPGGGGGGGGGSGGDNNNNHAGFMKQIERWYNWLRRIEKAQDKINLLQKEYNLLTNDNIANGHKVYENIRDRIRALEEERKTHESLAASQREYYDQERARFEATGFDQLYDFNADGVLELRNDPTFDSERIRRQMNDLGTQRFDGGGHLTVTRQGDNVRLSGQRVARDESGNVQLDDDGKVVLEGEKTRKFKIPTTGLELMNLLTQTTEHGNAKWSIEDQFMILRSLGFDKDLKYDENGNEVVKNLDNATVDEMRAAVEGWFAEADQWRDHFDGLDESIQEQTEAAMDNSAEIQRLQEELAKNELDLEKQIMNAVKDRRQAEIDNLQAQRDAFSEAADKMVNGLTEQLNKERQMYETSQNQNELEKLQRQLGILQRSGGSGSQIQSLQEQIRSKQQDIYFDERQQQIDAIKEASDKQLEKMDNQIDLMQRTLQYEEEHGLLWREVRDIMRETPAEIAEYIATYSSDYRASSALDQSRQTTATTESAQEYQASAIQPRAQKYVKKKKYKGDIATAAENAYIESYTSATGGTEAERRAAAEAAADQAAATAMDEAESNSAKQEFLAWTTKRGIPASEDSAYKKAEALFIKGYKNAKKDKKKAAIKKVQAVYDIVGEKGKKKFKKKKKSDEASTATNAYATGGLVNETGLAWLDGTKSKPEYVLSAKQTAFLRDELLNSRESMSGLVAELRQMFNGGENAVLSAVNNSTSTDEGIKIQHLDVNMNVASLGSDYDVEQAANAMFNKMTKIARKSGTRSVARR